MAIDVYEWAMRGGMEEMVGKGGREANERIERFINTSAGRRGRKGASGPLSKLAGSSGRKVEPNAFGTTTTASGKRASQVPAGHLSRL